jgi:hypothetical protein
VRVRVRRLERSPDNPHPLAAEGRVEGAAELRVTIVDQEPRPLLVQATYSIRRVPMQMTASTYRRRSKTVSTVKKSQASVVAACSRIARPNGSVRAV